MTEARGGIYIYYSKTKRRIAGNISTTASSEYSTVVLEPIDASYSTSQPPLEAVGFDTKTTAMD